MLDEIVRRDEDLACVSGRLRKIARAQPADRRFRTGAAWPAGSLAATALVHGAYNAVLEPGAPSAVIVLVVWVTVILAACRAALRDDVAAAG